MRGDAGHITGGDAGAMRDTSRNRFASSRFRRNVPPLQESLGRFSSSAPCVEPLKGYDGSQP
jgi:hypothetical protein